MVWTLRKGLSGLALGAGQKLPRNALAVFSQVVTDHADALVVVDEQGKIIASSRNAERLFGASHSLEGASAATVLPLMLTEAVNSALKAASPDGAITSGTVETTLRDTRVSGGDIVVEYDVTVSPVAGDESGKLEYVACLTCRDVTARNQAQKRINYLANHDHLTGALSRTRLFGKIQEFVDLWDSDQRALTLVLIDLDRFKNVNETLGHAVGDELLRQVARRLEASGAYCVARLGADRFAMALPGLLDAAGQERLAQSIIKVVVAPYDIRQFRAMIGVSIGITDSRRSGTDPNMLLAHADMALSEAKLVPGNSFSVFEPELDARVQRKQALEVALRDALARGEMNIVYQPQVDLSTGEAIGAEALLRWHHPEMGHVSPDLFIPVAEDSGLIMEIGRWVLTTACQDAARWPIPARLAVNVSALQFEYGDLVADLDAAIAASGLPAGRIDLEITESVFIRKTDVLVKRLEAIRERGVRVALDDFGMGYSSLGYLSRLPIDKVKVDKSFVRHLPDDHEAMAIIRSVLTLAETMQKSVIAEGIETADQAWVLRLAGCRIGQGYHFGRPQTQREFAALLAEEGPAFKLRAIA